MSSVANTPLQAACSSVAQSAPQPRHAPAALKFWHLASLDAPTVAVIWAAAFAWVARVRPPVWILALLFLVVWAVYIADRLLDARAGLRTPPLHLLRERHYFHWRHRSIFAPLAAFATLAALVIVRSQVHAVALREDSVVAAATLAYFSGVHARIELPSLAERVLPRQFLTRLVSREFLVGMLFSAGCILPALTIAPSSFAPLRTLAVPALFFAALAWLNVRAIGLWEAPPQLHPTGVFSMAIGLGLVAAVAACAFSSRPAALLLAASASSFFLAFLDRHRLRFSPLTLRAAADVVLLTPLLLAPVARFLP